MRAQDREYVTTMRHIRDGICEHDINVDYCRRCADEQ